MSSENDLQVAAPMLLDDEPMPDAEPAVAPTYEQNDLVWAKTRGFPWWPARVAGTRRTDAKGVRYPVRFFHTAERIELSPMPSTLLPYSSREDLAHSTKIKSKAIRTKFELALLELSKEPTKGADDDPTEVWRDEGHEYLGRRVARPFEGGLTVVGRIMRWLPAGDGEDEPPLFHVDHDDGDEEDLEECEVIDAFELYKTTPEATKLAQAKVRAEARAAKEEEKTVKAEARAAKASERAAAATTAEAKAAAEEEARAARLEVKAYRAAALAARVDTSGAEAAVAEAMEEAMAAKAAFSKVAAEAKEAAAAARASAREAKAKAAEEAKKKREAERGPRSAKTAVQFYTEAERLKLTAAHPGLDASAIAGRIKAQWKVLEEADKAPYKELAAADKQRYEAECAASGIDPAAKRRKSREGGAAESATPASAEADATTAAAFEVDDGVPELLPFAVALSAAGAAAAAMAAAVNSDSCGHSESDRAAPTAAAAAPPKNPKAAASKATSAKAVPALQPAAEPDAVATPPDDAAATALVVQSKLARGGRREAAASSREHAKAQSSPPAADVATLPRCHNKDTTGCSFFGGPTGYCSQCASLKPPGAAPKGALTALSPSDTADTAAVHVAVAGLPTGWVAFKRTGKARSYSTYKGPQGERAKSMTQAWRIHNGRFPPAAPALAASASTAAAAANTPLTLQVPTSEAAGKTESIPTDGEACEAAAKPAKKPASKLAAQASARVRQSVAKQLQKEIDKSARAGRKLSATARKGLERRLMAAAISKAERPKVAAQAAPTAALEAASGSSSGAISSSSSSAPPPPLTADAKAGSRLAAAAKAAAAIRYAPMRSPLIDAPAQAAAPLLTCGTLPTVENAASLARLTIEVLTQPVVMAAAAQAPVPAQDAASLSAAGAARPTPAPAAMHVPAPLPMPIGSSIAAAVIAANAAAEEADRRHSLAAALAVATNAREEQSAAAPAPGAADAAAGVDSMVVDAEVAALTAAVTAKRPNEADGVAPPAGAPPSSSSPGLATASSTSAGSSSCASLPPVPPVPPPLPPSQRRLRVLLVEELPGLAAAEPRAETVEGAACTSAVFSRDASAQTLKELGNSAFGARCFKMAADFYSFALHAASSGSGPELLSTMPLGVPCQGGERGGRSGIGEDGSGHQWDHADERWRRLMPRRRERIDVEVKEDGKLEWRQAIVTKRLPPTTFRSASFTCVVCYPDGTPDEDFIETYRLTSIGKEWRRREGGCNLEDKITSDVHSAESEGVVDGGDADEGEDNVAPPDPRLLVTLRTSRAEARLQLGRYTAALADCDAALAIEPTHDKSLSRRDRALAGQQQQQQQQAAGMVGVCTGEEDVGERRQRTASAFCGAIAAALVVSSTVATASDRLTPLTEVSVHWMPTVLSETCVGAWGLARLHESLNAAADFVHEARRRGDAVLICSAANATVAAPAATEAAAAAPAAAAAASDLATKATPAAAGAAATADSATKAKKRKAPRSEGGGSGEVEPREAPPKKAPKKAESAAAPDEAAADGGSAGRSAGRIAGGSAGGSAGGGADGASAVSAGDKPGSASSSERAVASQPDSWARAIAFAYDVRWRSALAADVLPRSGLHKSRLREACAGYAPLLFSISLFETAPGAKSFAHYAAATVAFMSDKLAHFGGCEFQLHLNAGAAAHTSLLRRLHEASRGRIRFVEFNFVPRPRIAPWLLAAMRLAPLLSVRSRTVVTADIHDDLALQNAQIRSLLMRLRRESRELCLTWWLAEDGADDCLLNCALPVPKLRQYVTDRAYHDPNCCGGVAVHAHMDAGLMIATGERLRETILAGHKGKTFVEYLQEMVTGAPTIPHGIEEMAWDSYLTDVGWHKLTPSVLFSVHRSLLAGRDSKDPFKHIVTASPAPHQLRLRREEVDVGKAEFAFTLPTCRHSQALDCAEDSAAWLKRDQARS